jgi:hypothetical protein
MYYSPATEHGWMEAELHQPLRSDSRHPLAATDQGLQLLQQPLKA